jgi:hypothetical protein
VTAGSFEAVGSGLALVAVVRAWSDCRERIYNGSVPASGMTPEVAPKCVLA